MAEEPPSILPPDGAGTVVAVAPHPGRPAGILFVVSSKTIAQDPSSWI